MTIYLVLVLVLVGRNFGQVLQWEKLFDTLSYEPSSKPAPRIHSALGHDKERNRIVLFGGIQTNNHDINTALIPVLFDDTWEFNLETSKSNFI